MLRNSLTCVLAGFLIASLSGCVALSRGIGSVTSDKNAEARSGSLWIVPPPQLEPPAENQRSVYISFRNISDAQDIDLTEGIRGAAMRQGWNVINDPAKATYRLRASLRFFGEVEPESGGSLVAAGLGTITGAAVGVGIGRGISRVTGSNSAALAGGGLVGSMMAAGLVNSSKPREYAAIIDFVLEEKQSSPITFTLATDSASNTRDGGGTGNARMGSSGGTTGGNTTFASASRTSNYFPHGVRLSAWANQMAMKDVEALPLITSRVEKVVTQMLPM